ncbi:MAG: peptidoglycan DD-metalloendopeptidase family protein [Roseiarcus sp.]
MLRSVAFNRGRRVAGFVVVGLAGAWLSGCSTDATRFGAGAGNPFSDPFASNAPPAATPKVVSQPLPGSANSAYAVPAHPSPSAVAVAAPPSPIHTGAIQPNSVQAVGGSAAGWTAVGGTPVVVVEGDTVETLSGRYGVPTAALLHANGLASPSQVRAGMRIIVPVYNANARSVAAAAPIPPASEPKRRHGLESARADDEDQDDEPTRKAKAKAVERAAADEHKDDARLKAEDKLKAEKKKRLEAEDRSADDHVKPESKTKAKAEKEAEAVDAHKAEREAKAKKDEERKVAEAKKDEEKKKVTEAKAEKVKLDKSKPEKAAEAQKTASAKPESKKVAAVDPTPTSTVAPAEAKVAADDAKGASPEFRWPARGRIIEGFKQGGNDGINISVPAGTSVRAAENGVVAYAGSGLKGYGNLVLIQHPNGFVSAYANNGELDVKRGETVKRGQVIAKSGDSGNVTSPQLHFELRNKGGQPVDPTAYLAGL